MLVVAVRKSPGMEAGYHAIIKNAIIILGNKIEETQWTRIILNKSIKHRGCKPPGMFCLVEQKRVRVVLYCPCSNVLLRCTPPRLFHPCKERSLMCFTDRVLVSVVVIGTFRKMILYSWVCVAITCKNKVL